MQLNIIVDEQTYPVSVPEEIISEAEDFFKKMDADMDRGWQMSRKWVERPTGAERCQIAANKLLTAMENDNQQLAVLMAAYILSRMPGIEAVDIDTSGDMRSTELIMSRVE